MCSLGAQYAKHPWIWHGYPSTLHLSQGSPCIRFCYILFLGVGLGVVPARYHKIFSKFRREYKMYSSYAKMHCNCPSRCLAVLQKQKASDLCDADAPNLVLSCLCGIYSWQGHSGMLANVDWLPIGNQEISYDLVLRFSPSCKPSCKPSCIFDRHARLIGFYDVHRGCSPKPCKLFAQSSSLKDCTNYMFTNMFIFAYKGPRRPAEGAIVESLST